MPRVYKRSFGARNYKCYDEETLNAALQQIKSGRMSLREASSIFKIPLGTLSHKMNRKYGGKAGHPLTFTEDEEASFVEHIKTVALWGFPFDIFDLRFLVQTYLNSKGRSVKVFQNNLPSAEWAGSFLKRHKTQLASRCCQNIKRTRASVSAKDVLMYFSQLEKTLNDGEEIPPQNIFNYDETNLSDNPGVKKCIFKRGVKYAERIQDSTKASISIMYCGSAAGELLPCYVVYKAENLWSTWMEGAPPGTRFNRTRSGWFDSCCFSDWFESLFIPNAKKLIGRKLLIGDNLSSHFTEKVLSLASEHNIAFVCLTPNSTHLLQPLDVAFYGPLKRKWRSILDEWKSSAKKGSRTLSKDAFPGLLQKLNDSLINKSENLQSGFLKCGIYPFNPQKVLERLPDHIININSNAGSDSNTDRRVSDAVIGVLRMMRGVDEDKPKKRRKKINVIPGKSITCDDLLEGEAGPSKSAIGRRERDDSEEEGSEENCGERSVGIDEETSEGIDEEESDEETSERSEKSDVDESEENNEDSIDLLDDESTSDVAVEELEAFEELNVFVGDYVIVQYEGQQFPGKVTSIVNEGAVVSTLIKCMRNGWRWPQTKDEIIYEWGDIVKVRPQAVPLNNRNILQFPDLEDMWGK